MSSVIEHYENLLAEHYTWIYGGYETKAEENAQFFNSHNIKPLKSRMAFDLGCGSGFQTIPLSQAGFKVTAIDLSDTLLTELKTRSVGLDITTINDDILNFPAYCSGPLELCVCMGDTITHLESKDKISELFSKAYQALDIGGKLVLSFRDLAFELKELDRFIPVRSDEERIFTCFLEYEADSVKVHDLIYLKNNNAWIFKKSFYRKTRVSFDWVKSSLIEASFTLEFSQIEKGFVVIIAIKE